MTTATPTRDEINAVMERAREYLEMALAFPTATRHRVDLSNTLSYLETLTKRRIEAELGGAA